MGLVPGGITRYSLMLRVTMDALEQPNTMPAMCNAQQPDLTILPLPSSSITAVMDSAWVSSRMISGMVSACSSPGTSSCSYGVKQRAHALRNSC